MRWLKLPALILGCLVLLGITAAGLWATFKVLTHSQQDNEKHLRAKQDYLSSLAQLPRKDNRPNILFILFDDLGYGDLGFTGSQAIETPTLDNLAAKGVVLNNFYSPAPYCTPARAGFLTGRLPLRAGMPQVVMPSQSPLGYLSRLLDHNKRIPAEEITLADVLGAAGYSTGIVGKWHLGDRAPSLPNDMGFQSYFGALYSNDMTPFALYRNRTIEIPAPADQTRLNEWYGAESVRFIEQNRGKPFFLYLAHNFPHIPLYRPAADKGRSAGGRYGDVIEGLDDMVERIVTALRETGQFENTLVLVTSDNGPWYQGNPGNERGRKGETFEGGMRVPMIAHWPAGLLGGRKIDGLAMGTDWFPTILEWLEVPLPQDRLIDGNSLRNMLQNDASSPNEFLYYFAGENLMAVRDARHKFHAKRTVPYVMAGQRFFFGAARGPWLIDLDTDRQESYDVIEAKPEVGQRLQRALEQKEQEMKTNRRGWL